MSTKPPVLIPKMKTHTPMASVDDLCQAVYTSAQDNDLPVQFFANLIWQESRLRADDVSRKGAQGIAQFMPETAVEKGLANPFDPMQALPARRGFLRELRLQFGNLGFVAAAYNADRAVSPIGSSTAAACRRRPAPTSCASPVFRSMRGATCRWTMRRSLSFAAVPCRGLPAYADLEQAQLARGPAEAAKVDSRSRKNYRLPAIRPETAEQNRPQHVAEHKHDHAPT